MWKSRDCQFAQRVSEYTLHGRRGHPGERTAYENNWKIIRKQRERREIGVLKARRDEIFAINEREPTRQLVRELDSARYRV